MSAPVKKNLKIFKGATYQIQFQYVDAALKAIPLIGYTARMQVRPFIESSDVVLDLTTGNGKIQWDDTLSVCTITLSPTDTTNVTVEEGVYDIELVSGSGSTVVKLAYGAVQFVPEVTR